MSQLVLNRQQSRQIDQLAIGRFGFSSLVLMENAGRGVADVLCRRGIAGPVVICCGKGNNAGDGLVIARHLQLRGHQVEVLMFAAKASIQGDAAANLRILQQCDVPIRWPDMRLDPSQLDTSLDVLLNTADWIVDALLGTGAHGTPRAPIDMVIDRINASSAPTLAVDIPSGLDCDSGVGCDQTIRATCTCTFVAMKPGLLADVARPYVGDVEVLDIGTPPRLIDELLGR